LGMRDAVMAHPVARTLVTGHVAEQTIIGTDNETGQLVKVRPDARTAVIADLKTTADANPYTVERKVIPERGYAQSAALYVDTVRQVLDLDLAFVLICVEKTAPYRVSVVEVGEDYLEDGRRRNRRALDLYRHGITTGEWPTWPATYTAQPPQWLDHETTRLTTPEQDK
ncbi:MAG: PD-(D/E)XK nuclease-like domain-containing protein, partial [Galactobacter sp.]